MTRLYLVFCASVLLQTRAITQPTAPSPQSSLFAGKISVYEGDDEKDSAYATYKSGYALILDDKWKEAITKLAEVKKFPKSSYLDDAAYWSAYAQSQLDKKKGNEAYQQFLKDYPESSYADDAMADMENITVTLPGNANNVRISGMPRAYSYSFGNSMRASRDAIQRAMREVKARWNTPVIPPGLFEFSEESRESKLDPQTRIKLAALQALGESENDKDAYATLKDIALDKSQPEIMRMRAISSLSDFRKFDVTSLFSDIARTDPNEEVQLAAIHSLSDGGGDKNKTVDALIGIFNSYPKQKNNQLQSALYGIANVGNDKAVDFLGKVATSNENIDLRSDAVYYLGNIGNAKSREVLLKILKTN